ncbi:hypothetical protein K4A83_16820 [Spirulina subsalsa FACHB-351]|uniref:UvrD-like helicase ATP-binding domain-containing protein n=1 Tax=Spirulina subsalsa FACHB-351 TaxID=234711 RepID=A0ABT3L8V5_9CYAN|nr:UvrD-helicase domain-containing protein [Spirulina subsalsa]MCW6037924.1 hypothetical protein [Spirulina subsalsa FACHB-351]
MYVYRTDTFNEQVLEKGVGDHVDRLCEDLKTMTLEQVLARFERVYPYLKRKEGNLRLIARIRRIGGEPVLCWLKVFRRGDREYEEFLRDRENFANHALESQIKEGHLWQWLNQQKTATLNLHAIATPLPDELRPWLDRPSLRMDLTGVVIYESEVWLTRFMTPEIQARWMTFNRLIADLADSTENMGEPTSWPGIQCYREENCWVFYQQITTLDPPERNILFLLTLFALSPSPEAINEDLQAIFGGDTPPQSPLNFDELSAIARRAYPSYLLADERHWLAIEKDEMANLALSAEEEAILHNVSTSKPSLPLFLNGQAGSGKSTLLFHLFADYAHRHLRERQQQKRRLLDKPHPLFLAYNNRLLKVAQERVIPLLASHHRFLAKRGYLEELPDIRPFFQSFRTFLRNLLPLEERDQFNDANYISFHQFRQLFYKTTWRDYTPEQCWQVIRTFIKGYHLDERDSYLEPEDYQEIPKKERTVTPELFQEIHETVWKWYDHHLKETGKWDDQDLIRRVLQLKCYRAEYTAIFCDEAQDFTRLELQLIMRLSVLSAYDLEHQHIESLPFAFAGDPLQTLNPTGFRWTSLKAAFYNEVITTLSPTGQLDLEMNFAELECNYRSTPAIVELNNLIQLWRRVLFDLPEINPQKARRHGDFPIQKLILGENISPDELQDYLQDTIIIVPCDQGGEADYIQQDSLLSNLCHSRRQQNFSPWNVLSAITAKGLEFKQVILYKFGEACHRNVWTIPESHSEEVKFFFNKLYVATSRATERLFVVDTPLGDQRLWRYGSHELELERFLARLADDEEREKWQNRVYLFGVSNGIAAMSADNIAAIALTFETEGINTENPDLVRRAQAAYEQIGDELNALSCEAWALKLEEHYLEAGKLFQGVENWGEAWNCFWAGMHWDELWAWYNHGGEVEKKAQKMRPLVEFLATDQPAFKQIEEFTALLCQEVAANTLDSHRFQAQWQLAIQGYAQAIERILEPSGEVEREQWQQFGEVLAHLATGKDPGMCALAGDCFYRAKNYEQAIHCWDRIDQTATLDYQLAKAAIVGLPESLEYWAHAQQFGHILTAWHGENQPRTPDWLTYVGPALESSQLWLEALLVYAELGNRDKVGFCLEQAIAAGEHKVALQSVLSDEIEHHQWEEAIALLEKYPLPGEEQVALTGWFAQQLAYSELTPNQLSKDLQRQYQKMLKDYILLHPDWSLWLSVPQLGVTLERVGIVNDILDYYDRYIHHEEEDIADFARHRWLVNKKTQEEDFSQQGQVKKALKSRADLQRKSQEWGIALDHLSRPIPVPPDATPVVSSPPPRDGDTSIQGLPPEVVIESPQPNILSFQVRHLLFRVMPLTQQVLILDQLGDRELRIDAQLQQVTLGSFTLHTQGQSNLLFSDSSGSYSGILLCHESPPRLEITIQAIANKIVIPFIQP